MRIIHFKLPKRKRRRLAEVCREDCYIVESIETRIHEPITDPPQNLNDVVQDIQSSPLIPHKEETPTTQQPREDIDIQHHDIMPSTVHDTSQYQLRSPPLPPPTPPPTPTTPTPVTPAKTSTKLIDTESKNTTETDTPNFSMFFKPYLQREPSDQAIQEPIILDSSDDEIQLAQTSSNQLPQCIEQSLESSQKNSQMLSGEGVGTAQAMGVNAILPVLNEFVADLNTIRDEVLCLKTNQEQLRNLFNKLKYIVDCTYDLNRAQSIMCSLESNKLELDRDNWKHKALSQSQSQSQDIDTTTSSSTSLSQTVSTSVNANTVNNPEPSIIDHQVAPYRHSSQNPNEYSQDGNDIIYVEDSPPHISLDFGLPVSQSCTPDIIQHPTISEVLPTTNYEGTEHSKNMVALARKKVRIRTSQNQVYEYSQPTQPLSK